MGNAYWRIGGTQSFEWDDANSDHWQITYVIDTGIYEVLKNSVSQGTSTTQYPVVTFSGVLSWVDITDVPFPLPTIDITSDLHGVDQTGKIWTLHGEAQMSSICKYGSQAYYSPATGINKLTTAYHNDFDIGSQDFVWECQVRNFATLYQIFGPNDVYASPAMFYVGKSGVMVIAQLYFTDTTGLQLAVSFNIESTYRHLALVRSGATVYLFGDGTLLGSGDVGTKSLIAPINGVNIGDCNIVFTGGGGLADPPDCFRGYIDEMCLSVGTDKGWTSNFTPPTSGLVPDIYTKMLLNFENAPIALAPFSDPPTLINSSPAYVHNEACITPAMTAADAPSPIVIAVSSSYNSSQDGWNAFDQVDDTENCWSAAERTFPQWIKIYLGETGLRIAGYSLSARSDEDLYMTTPSEWKLYGSVDDTDWVELDHQIGIIDWHSLEMRTFSLGSSTAPYNYFKFEVLDSEGLYSPAIGELELLGVPPIALEINDSLDLTDDIEVSGGASVFYLIVTDELGLFGLVGLGANIFSETSLDEFLLYDELHHGWKVTAESSLILTDAIEIILGIIVDEWITFIDVQSNNWNGREIISENVTLYDIAGFAKIYADSLSDELHIADISTYELTITVLEYLGFTELANAMRTSAAAISDSINVIDNPALEFPLSVESVLSVIDLSTVAVQFLHSVQSDLGLADVSSLIKRISDTVTDPIVFVDTITSHAHLYSLIYDTLALNVIVELDGEVWECYVLNTPKFHPSMYSGFNFNSFCVFENRAFGANDTGIYELTGDTDAGSPIHTGVILSKTNFNSPNQKRFRRGYLDISGTSPKMILETGEGQRQAYAIDEQGKMVASHELKSKSWILSIADFETLNSMKLIPVILTK